jgi:hypothetical protein
MVDIVGSGIFQTSDWTGAGSPTVFTILGFSSIPDYTFNMWPHNTTITSVTIGASVVSIGSSAFKDCRAFTTLTFAENSDLTTIGYNAFRNSNLTAVAIPSKVTSIGFWAFALNYSLATVTFAENSELTTIGHHAFQDTGLTTIAIPAGVNSIGSDAFFYCNALETVYMGDVTATAVGVTFGQDQSFLGSPSTTDWIDATIPVPTCFPSGTPIATDQGVIMIENLTKQNTIRGTPVIRVTRSTGHRSVISLPRNSLYKNVPSQDTYCSLEHKVFHNGKMTKARDLVNKCDHVTRVPHDGAPLYNVLLPTHSRMVVNNLIAETLHPQNAAARAPLRAPSASVRR